ncbi:MAG: hypothetical protein KIT00_09470, partial [Rhodospirillales bacterium]|nr:hypothetical protein [Rhodospirillales bacterium]
ETLSGKEVESLLRGEPIIRPEHLDEPPKKDSGRRSSVPSSGSSKSKSGRRGGFEAEPQPGQ